MNKTFCHFSWMTCTVRSNRWWRNPCRPYWNVRWRTPTRKSGQYIHVNLIVSPCTKAGYFPYLSWKQGASVWLCLKWPCVIATWSWPYLLSSWQILSKRTIFGMLCTLSFWLYSQLVWWTNDWYACSHIKNYNSYIIRTSYHFENRWFIGGMTKHSMDVGQKNSD